MPNPPQRVWPLQGATNFRDLGGYPGQDGRPVRWRRLFRSDHLAGLTEADKSLLAGLGLAKAFDFRGHAERAAVTYELPGVTQHSLAIEPTVVQRLQDLVNSGEALTAARAAELMTELYRALVNDQSHRFAELFEQLLQAEGPVVFHCTAGKDRTGVAVALVLEALNVRRDAIVEDYVLTNTAVDLREQLLGRSATGAGLAATADLLLALSPTALDAVLSARPEYILASLDAIESRHGSVRRYLLDELQIEPPVLERMQQRLLD